MPESLRLGTDDAIFAVLFKLQAIAAVDEMKITRATRFQNNRNLFCGTFAGAMLEGPRRHLLNGRYWGYLFPRRRFGRAAHRVRLALFGAASIRRAGFAA